MTAIVTIDRRSIAPACRSRCSMPVRIARPMRWSMMRSWPSRGWRPGHKVLPIGRAKAGNARPQPFKISDVGFFAIEYRRV
jgi:hypothetical protein